MMKRIALIVMCIMLTATVIVTGVVVHKVAPILGVLITGFGDMQNQNNDASADSSDPTDPSQPSSGPTQPPHEHDYSKLEKNKSAKCTEPGVKIYSCECGDKKLQTLPAYGHSYGSWKVVAATCDTDGYTKRTCGICGDVEKKDTVVKLGHDFVPGATTEPNCEAPGTQEYSCQREDCGEVKIEIVAEALGHNWIQGDTYPPTCAEEGYTEYTCDKEGCPAVTKREDIQPKLEHNYGQWETVTEPQAGVPGVQKRICGDCFYEEEQQIPLGILETGGISRSEDAEACYFVVNVGSKNSAGEDVTVYTYHITDGSMLMENTDISYDPAVGLEIYFISTTGEKHYALPVGNYDLVLDIMGDRVETDPGDGGDSTEESTPAESGGEE